MKPILLSGIQPSGRLHLGNYLGALKNFVDLQNSGKYQCFFFIADLHSLTETYNPKEKSKQILELTADYLAAGLDPKKSTIFLQSQIPAHTELTWILNTLTPMGELRRMTQFKDKSERHAASPDKLFHEFMHVKKEDSEKINVGLFDYPVLMAADILLYNTKFVPVGDDQLQHLELTRTLARKFNTKFGQTFFEPKAVLTPTSRVMSLNNPEKKMSKSDPATCIFLDDSPEEIKNKIKRAVTDSGNEIKHHPQSKPAISNLLEIYSSLEEQVIKEVENDFKNKTYADFKSSLANLIINHFANYRKNKKSLMAKPQTLKTILNSGSKTTNQIASKKINEVKKKIGLTL